MRFLNICLGFMLAFLAFASHADGIDSSKARKTEPPVKDIHPDARDQVPARREQMSDIFKEADQREGRSIPRPDASPTPGK